jgi:arginine-tRNA-protein transferase
MRLEVSQFVPTRTQRRAWKKGQREITSEVIRPTCDQQRIDLFNRHRLERGLARHEGRVEEEGYRMFLTESCCDSWELDYRVDGRLIGVALCDRGAQSLSAVYCYYDPAESKRSLGVYSVLMHVELCRQWDLKYLYLGYYVADCAHMNYKQSYKPHERLIDGQWVAFSRE